AKRWSGILLLKRAKEARIEGRMHLGDAQRAQEAAELETARRERLAALAHLGRAVELCQQAIDVFTPIAAGSTASAEAARDILLAYNEIGSIEMFTARALRLLAEITEDVGEAEGYRQ